MKIERFPYLLSLFLLYFIYNFYIFIVQPYPYWLDSPQFTAVAFNLGLPQPPGHPLYVLLAKLFCFFPIGSIPFKVALFSVFLSLISFFILCQILSIPFGKTSLMRVELIIVVLALVNFYFAEGTIHHATRQEVYMLQFFINIYIIFLGLKGYYNTLPTQHILTIGFVFGLGLCNHHFSTLILTPLFLFLIVLIKLRHRSLPIFKTLLLTISFSLYGLIPYLYIPLRSITTHDDISLSLSYNFDTFLWVITTKVFQKAFLSHSTSPSVYSDPLSLLWLIVSNLTFLSFPAALGGLYFIFRRKETSLVGVIFFLGIILPLLARATLGFEPSNPDVYGYILISVASIVILNGIFWSIVYQVISTRSKFKFVPCIAIILILLTTSGFQFERMLTSRVIKFKNSTDSIFFTTLVRPLHNSILFTDYFETTFVIWYLKNIEGIRSDLIHISLPFLCYPGYFYATVGSKKLATPIYNVGLDIITFNKVSEKNISLLAQLSPVYIEGSLERIVDLRNYLFGGAPPFYKIMPQPLSKEDLITSHKSFVTTLEQLKRLIKDELEEAHASKLIVWWYFIHSYILLGSGLKEEAINSLDMALLLNKEDKRLLLLKETIIKIPSQKLKELDVISLIKSNSYLLP